MSVITKKHRNGGKSIKLADAIHNIPTMIRDNPNYVSRYVAEKKILLVVIRDGYPLLASILDRVIEYFERESLTVFDLYDSILRNKR